jgi:hypothetical protein
MSVRHLALLGTVLVMTTAAGTPAALARDDDDGRGVLVRKLVGVKEVPAVISTGSGTVQLRVRRDRIEYRLSYRNLEGAVIQAHIHVAQPDVNGGIAAWLCGTASSPGPTGTPTCPASPGTVTGTISATSLFTPVPAQSVDVFADFLTALRSGVTYANVHTTEVPSGEIRGNLRDRRHDHHD